MVDRSTAFNFIGFSYRYLPLEQENSGMKIQVATKLLAVNLASQLIRQEMNAPVKRLGQRENINDKLVTNQTRKGYGLLHLPNRTG